MVMKYPNGKEVLLTATTEIITKLDKALDAHIAILDFLAKAVSWLGYLFLMYMVITFGRVYYSILVIAQPANEPSIWTIIEFFIRQMV